MNIAQALALAATELARPGIAEPMRDARCILADVIGTTHLDPHRQLSDDHLRQFTGKIAERRQFRPVSQIVGYREFWGRKFKVTKDVLDPRPDTETLVERALSLPPPARLLDLGTGSGVLAISLLCEWPHASGVAADISEPALAVAAHNAVTHGLADRLQLIQSDWFSAVAGQFDLIISNPPYIAGSEMAGLAADIRLWEPVSALTPGTTGLEAYEAIFAGLAEKLRPGGRALFETGYRQASAVAALLNRRDLGDVLVHRDINGHDRVVELRRRDAQ